MKHLILAASAAIGACACSQQAAAPADLAGRWEVQQIAGASLGEGVDIWIEIDPQAGAISGFTGCNAFTATLTAFGESLAVSGVAEEARDCAGPEAATDEVRFLTVLPQIQRRIRHGDSLELLQAPSGSEALLRLRLVDEPS